MANVRDSDTSLWLHNKLGVSNDSWTGGSICSQLNVEVLRNIRECFPDLQTQVKLKLLLSFFHIPRKNLEDWRNELEQIVDIALVDTELWVSMLAESLKTYPSTMSLNTEINELEEIRPIFSDLVSDLKKLVRKQSDNNLLPMECHYLNKLGLTSVVGYKPENMKHFNIRKRQKSAILRADLLQKSNDAASNLKKSSAPVVPVRSRGMPRKMTDTTPLKGIPSRMPISGFRSGVLNSVNNKPSMARLAAGRKEGGVKLLDIADQPLGYVAAKKRKKMQELEEAKKSLDQQIVTPTLQTQTPPTSSTPTIVTTTPSTTITPDYAVGLQSTTYSSNKAASPAVQPKNDETLQLSTNLPSVGTIPEPTTSSLVQSQLSTEHVVKVITPITVVTNKPVVQPAPSSVAHIRIQPQANASNLQRRGLALTREQMLEAQDMFRTANKVTRPEKALILGFMAGSRDNPCPHLGNVVTIKLSEDQENVLQADETYLTMIAETHFQMNYNNGEWKRIKRYKHIENVIEQVSHSKNTSTSTLMGS